MWNVSGAEPHLAFEISEHISWLTAFASDGQHIGVVINHYSPADTERANPTTLAHVFDLATGRDAATPQAADKYSLLLFHPTEDQLAISDATAVRIIEWRTGNELSRWNRPLTHPMAWSRDGRQLLARSIDEGDPRIYRWDVVLHRELPPLATGRAVRHPDRIVFSHRGDQFVSASRYRLQVWEFPSARLLWDSNSTPLMSIRFSPDDELLLGAMSAYPKVHILRMADGHELPRVALSASPVDIELTHRAVISRDGRILAAPSAAGTHLIDLQTNMELDVISGKRMPLLFDPDGGLLTHADAPEGVVRWPIRFDVATSEITVGAPQSLTEIRDENSSDPSLFAGLGQWSASGDGRVIATPWQRDRTGAGANIFTADRDDRTKYRCLVLGSQHDVRSTSVSPDGKYVATGSVSWFAKRDEVKDSVTVWDTATGRRIKDLLVGQGLPQFSLDGKWIAVNAAHPAVRLWRVGSWQPGPAQAEGPGTSVIFDAESRLMAVSGQQIRLLNPETGREVARLAHPELADLAPTCFTPDGNRLIAFGMHEDQWCVWIWDLQLIRQQLAELGLDWDADQ